MISDTYLERLHHGGKTLGELLDMRLESGCSDCGRRLTLDAETAVNVCSECQNVFLRESSHA